jgi:hypothetical protein
MSQWVFPEGSMRFRNDGTGRTSFRAMLNEEAPELPHGLLFLMPFSRRSVDSAYTVSDDDQ